MKKYVFVILWLITVGFLFGQERSISGKVIDATSGDPLIFANVSIEGTTQGVETDLDGEFTLNGVKEDAILVVSYLGYTSKKIELTDEDYYEIQLASDAQVLEDVVVIGYGSESRRNVTGAVTKIDGDFIGKLDPPNAAQALQGTAAGVNISQQGGAPGSESNIRIRGISTNGNNAPLIILDGFQYEGGLNSINPQDIESITVLKDAQAAIYGTIASNGVILITTKSGSRNQEAVVDYQAYYGIQQTSRQLDLLNGEEYALLLNEAYVNAGQQSPISEALGEIGEGTDWQDEVFAVAPMMSHNLSVRGGTDKTSYSLSGSILNQDGIVGEEKSQFSRRTAALTLESDVKEKVNVSTRLFYYSTQNNSLNDFGLGSVLFNALNMAPTIDASVENLQGEIDLGNEVVNPIPQIRNTFNDSRTNRLSGTAQLKYDYANNLDLQVRMGFNTAFTQNRDFIPMFDYGPGKVFNRVDENLVSQGKINDNDYTFDIFNTYKNRFGDRHAVTFVAGMTVFRQFGEGLLGTSTGVPSNDIQFADIGTATGAGENLSASSYAYDVRRLSYFGRLKYTLNEKYLFSGILRRDASTRFGPNNRVGYFPSFTAGWVFSDEPFFPEWRALDFMKVRGGYGIMGNDRIPDFLYLALLTGQATYVSGVDNGLINGIAVGPLANPNVQWEESKKANIGTDVRLFGNKVNLAVDYYRDVTANLLIANLPISGIFGVSAPGASGPTINAGTVRNQGFEIELSYSDTWGSELGVNMSANFTSINNEVTEINGGDFLEGGQFGVGQPAPSRMEVGQPIGYFYGYKTDGIFQNIEEVRNHPSQLQLGAEAQPGDIRFSDINGDGEITPDDRTYIGDPIPDFTVGYTLNFNYKNFDLSTVLFGSFGNEIVRNFERSQPNVNRMNYRLDRWTGEGTSDFVPRATVAPTANDVFSDFFVEDGSFVRIQNVNIGYNLPTRWVERIALKELMVYARVDNLFTFTEYSGYDPTASTGAPIGGGIDFGFYPIPRNFIFGVKAQF
jgi:TonB-linked SusC/RagA family outer membrane protein